MADLRAAYAVVTAQALPELRDPAVRSGIRFAYNFKSLRCNDAAVNVQTARNRYCICCSPICRPRFSRLRHSLASNSWLSGKGRCCFAALCQLCISSLLFCLFVTSERISARRSCRFSERIHSFTSTPSGSCSHGAGRSSGCSVRCCPFPVHGDSYLPQVQGAAGPPWKIKTIFAGTVFRFRFYVLPASGCPDACTHGGFPDEW